MLLMDTLIFLCFSLLLMIYADHKGLGRLIIFIQTYPQKFQPFHASLFRAFFVFEKLSEYLRKRRLGLIGQFDDN